MNVLIVDDSKAMRCIIARALREMGVPGSPYLEAPNGKVALQTIAESNPELVISDLNMPEMSGMELLQALRTNGTDLAFGFVTSEASAQLRQEAADAGAKFVVTKPFTASNLSVTLGPVLAGLGCSTRTVDSDGPAATGTGTAFPKALQVGMTLKELLRRNINAAPCPPMLRPKEGWVVAEYQLDDGSLVGYAICDLPFAVRTGAALTLIPPGAAEDAIKAHALEDTVSENFREVLNVMARFFDRGGNSRVHLGLVHLPGENMGAAFAMQIAKPAARMDASVDVGGYGKGTLMLLSLAAAAKK